MGSRVGLVIDGWQCREPFTYMATTVIRYEKVIKRHLAIISYLAETDSTPRRPSQSQGVL